MTLAMAKIVAYKADKGKLNIPDEFDVMFNPTELTLSKGVQIAEIGIPGLDTPVLQYVRGQNEKLSLDLFFDSTHTGMNEKAKDVKADTDRFYQLVKLQSKTHAAPRVVFTWGTFLEFTAIVESVQRKFSLFSPDGRPLRATLSVTFREYKTISEQVTEFNLQSPNHTQRVIYKRGETLTQIAQREYDDPGQWRRIADANALNNVRKLRPGTVLRIPPIDRPARVG